jgi:hypothetical protein
MIGLPAPCRAATRRSGRAATRPPGRASSPPSGPVLFARYAFGPNRLGYCGPQAPDELLETAATRSTSKDRDAALRQLAHGFDGAWPYLQLIAEANGIEDPLDSRVVEAYWLGNDLLERVGPEALAGSLATRFRPRLRADGWRWLSEKPSAGAVPVHAFHVLDVFPRIGLLRSGSVDRALEVMDACRIRWGRVLERAGDALIVSVVPLTLVDGRLTLGAARAERVDAWRDGAGFVDGAQPGDIVSVHWSWACDRLSAGQLSRLVAWTAAEIAIANQTI